MSVLLDTNAYCAFHQGNADVVKIVENADKVVMSTIVVGELLFGFYNGTRYQKNLDLLQSFLAEPDVVAVAVSLSTSERYGFIASSLRSKGRAIPTNDIWIAAHAIETHASLVSFDVHFRHVDGIDFIRPGGTG